MHVAPMAECVLVPKTLEHELAWDAMDRVHPEYMVLRNVYVHEQSCLFNLFPLYDLCCVA